MIKLLFGLFVILTTNCALAQSSTVALISEDTGDLWMQVTDNPAYSPYDAATLWAALRGFDSRKLIETPFLKIACETLVSEPQKQRFGTCNIEVKAAKLKHTLEGVGILLNGDEARQVLEKFEGSEDPESFRKDLRLAGGEFLLTADHPRNLFLILVKKSLFPKPEN